MSEVQAPQIVEAGYVNGALTVALKKLPDGVRGDSEGEEAGTAAVASTIAKAIEKTLKGARRCVQVIRAATAKEGELKAKRADLEREKKCAPHTLFGPSLTAKLAELKAQTDALNDLIQAADDERHQAQRELLALRDAAVTAAPVAVRRSLADQKATLLTARQKAEADLLAALAKPLAVLMSVQAQLVVLGEVRPTIRVEDALMDALPEAFAEGTGLAPIRVEYEEPRREEVPISQPWRRRGHEDDYGITDDRWERD